MFVSKLSIRQIVQLEKLKKMENVKITRTFCRFPGEDYGGVQISFKDQDGVKFTGLWVGMYPPDDLSKKLTRSYIKSLRECIIEDVQTSIDCCDKFKSLREEEV